MVIAESNSALHEPTWLDQLPNHAIFTAQTGNQGRQCMVVRNSDLLFANGKVLRKTSLLEAKHNNLHSPSTSSTTSHSNASKELVSDALDFDIVELILNPAGNLLAVVGSHKVVVVVLPRPGVYSSRNVGSQVPVKAATVGSYYYHERIGGRAKIASVKWHPWGRLGSSLLVLSKDGLLREFDVSTDVEEPAQTASLLPSTPKQTKPVSTRSKVRSLNKSLRSRTRSQTPTTMNRSTRSTSRFALDDDEENSDDDYVENGQSVNARTSGGSHAVTFTFGIDLRAAEDEQGGSTVRQNADWNAFTIYTLCGNGDIYALCPFMPKNASVPLSYIQALSSSISAKSASSVSSPVRSNRDLQTRYVTLLLKQAQASRREGPSTSPPRARSIKSATPMSVDPRASTEPEETDNGDFFDELISLHPPPATLIPQIPRAQGPFLLSPAPIELSEDHENTSTDLMFARIKKNQASLDVLGVLGDDGRVDVCLLLEVMEPEWIGGSASRVGERKVSSSGRYALSDSDSEEEAEDETLDKLDIGPLPTLFVYETIDIGISSNMSSLQPRFVLDPLYSDSLYIQHAKGAHALTFGRWSKEILASMTVPEDDRPLAMERVLHKCIPSDLIPVVETSSLENGTENGVIGLSIVSDVYLSYSFLALTQSGVLVALELGLRVDHEEEGQYIEDAALHSRSTVAESLASTTTAYTSLLGDGPPFAPPEPFQSLNGLPYHPRKAIKDKQSSGEVRVTSETLRALATVVTTLRGEMRKIVQGGNIVQSRLELQIKELNRQLGKLSEARNRLEEAKQRETKLDSRIKRVMKSQGELVKRSDRLLQRLVENHSPEVSIYEIRWFKELQRLEEDVGKKGAEERDSDGLSARVAKLQYQLNVLKPELEKVKEEKSAKETLELMGAKQLQTIESLLAREAQLLALDRDKISQLQSRMQRQSLY